MSKAISYFRSALFIFGMTLSCILYAPMIVLLGLCTPVMWRNRLVRGWPRFCLWWLKVTCGLSYRISGWENLPDKASIVMAKHQSTWETLAICAYFPHPVFVAKRELLWVPFFGWAMAMLQYITIDRKAGKKAIDSMCTQARDRLARGFWVIIFPEGTRKAVDAAPNYRAGGAVMASVTGAEVVPVAHNAGYFWPRHGFLKRPGIIDLKILPAISPEGKNATQIIKQVQEAIESTQATLPK